MTINLFFIISLYLVLNFNLFTLKFSTEESGGASPAQRAPSARVL